MSGPVTGQGLDRVDARAKVMGKATYATETPVANVAHAVIVGASIGKGKITSIDRTKAENVAGVLAVLTHQNAPKLPGADKPPTSPTDRRLQFLQGDEIFYDGQPIALVVAETLESAREAAGLVVATYDAVKPSLSIEGEIGSAILPKEGPGGPPDTKHGDFDAAFAKAAVKVEQTYTMAPENHHPMESHGTIAVWEGVDRLTLHDATQGGFGVRQKMATLFDLPKENVRVISKFLGGGFGCKGSPWSHLPLCAMAARVTKRAVKLVVTRQQMSQIVGHRPRTIQHVALGADKSGKLLALKHELVAWTSRLDDFLEPAAAWSRHMYAVDDVITSNRLVRLDVATPTFMRAPGAASGSFAMESAMDELAYAASVDPLALRLTNYAEKDHDSGKPFTSKELRECYRRGAEKFGWSKRKMPPRSMRDGGWLIGWGVASASYPAHQRPSSASARVKPDGTVIVTAGTHDLGTGAYTVMAQVAADVVGQSYDKVRFELGDTAMPEAPGVGGSQTSASVGSAVKQACLQLRALLVQTAIADATSVLHGMAEADIDVADGFLFAKSQRTLMEPFAEVVRRTKKDQLEVKVDVKEKEERKAFACHSFGAQFCEVRVDETTGAIRVSRVVGAFAAGKILNTKTARSQYLGGIVWGIGLALLERTERDGRNGRVVTRELQDYHVPVNTDVPAIDVIFVDEVDPHINEIGVKGIGEIGITGMGAAIANAVFHATGKRVRDLPITLDKLL